MYLYIYMSIRVFVYMFLYTYIGRFRLRGPYQRGHVESTLDGRGLSDGRPPLGLRICAHRTDADSGWGLHLVVQCGPTASIKALVAGVLRTEGPDMDLEEQCSSYKGIYEKGIQCIETARWVVSVETYLETPMSVLFGFVVRSQLKVGGFEG